MTAWIHVVDTPFYAVTDREGRFRVAGLPPGEYRVRVWHEEVGRLAKEAGPQEITLAGPAEQSLKFVLTRRTGKKVGPRAAGRNAGDVLQAGRPGGQPGLRRSAVQ